MTAIWDGLTYGAMFLNGVISEGARKEMILRGQAGSSYGKTSPHRHPAAHRVAATGASRGCPKAPEAWGILILLDDPAGLIY